MMNTEELINYRVLTEFMVGLFNRRLESISRKHSIQCETTATLVPEVKEKFEIIMQTQNPEEEAVANMYKEVN